MPGDDTDLETVYSAQDYIDVSADDADKVGQTATGQYMIHQFKDYLGAQTQATFRCKAISTLAPSASTVYLEIYNRDTTTWDLLDSDSTTGADTAFELVGPVEDLSPYKDVNSVVSCRVYQEATG